MFVMILYYSVQAAEQMLKLYDVMYDNDVTMLEINPMVEAQDADGKKRGINSSYIIIIMSKYMHVFFTCEFGCLATLYANCQKYLYTCTCACVYGRCLWMIIH